MSNDVMERLSANLDICAEALKGKVIYLDYPIHWNVGDLLIWKGAQQFFKRHNKKLMGQYHIDNIGPKVHQRILESDTICFHGGGNLGDLWPWYQKKREEIIARYPQKRIVIFPQSVHFDDHVALERACSVFKAHTDLHIFVRDKQSLTVLQTRGVTNLKLSPDMAHALWGKISPTKSSKRKVLYLIRRDKETASLPPTLQDHTLIDWEDLLTGWMKKVYWFGLRINQADGGKGKNSLPAAAIWNVTSWLLIRRSIRLFAPYETIETNRLHAMILAALMQKKCAAYDNSYGKLSTYAECWFSDMPDISVKQDASYR